MPRYRKKPAAYRAVWAVGADYIGEPVAICRSTARGEWIEPITGASAEPVIGEVVFWTYRDEDTAKDEAAYRKAAGWRGEGEGE